MTTENPNFDENGYVVTSIPFRCPKCRGWTFGSSVGENGKGLKGYCHDAFGVSCRFQWDRADDRRVFVTPANVQYRASGVLK